MTLADRVRMKFLNFYFEYVRRSAAAHRDQFREIQAEAGRTSARVMRYIVLGEDVRYHGRWQQPVYTYTVRVQNGTIERLDDTTRPDVTVWSDVRTIEDIAHGDTLDERCPHGRRKFEPFDAGDAYVEGRLKFTGIGGLKELQLFRERILPQMKGEIKIGGRDWTPETRRMVCPVCSTKKPPNS